MARQPRLPWRDRGELWLAAGLRRLQRWFPRQVEAWSPTPPRLCEWGRAQPNAQAIPPTLWAFWSGARPPGLIQRCFDNWRRFNPGFAIHILNDENIAQFLPDVPAELAHATPQKRADWVRLEVLRRHGGIWLDASTILTQPLDWVLAEQARTQSDFVGYYLGRYTRDAAYPVVENWFMAAPPGSPFIADLQHEFTTRVVLRSNAEYIDRLRALGVYEAVRQNIDIPHYLSMHLALQYILRTRGGYRLSLARAEDGPFYYHAQGGWSRTGLKLRLLLRRAAPPLPPLVKLRKPDRKRLHLYVERGLFVPDSIVGQYLCQHHDPAPQDRL